MDVLITFFTLLTLWGVVMGIGMGFAAVGWTIYVSVRSEVKMWRILRGTKKG